MKRFPQFLSVFASLSFLTLLVVATPAQDKVDFEKEIKPIFAKLSDAEVAKIKKWIEQGASYHSAEKVDKFVQDMVKGGNSVRESVLKNSNGILSDMKVYRDGQKPGVVFKYTYAKGVTVDESRLTSKKIKAMMLPQLKNDKNVLQAMDLGIYTKIIYVSAAGKTYGEAIISKADFEKPDEE